jgi:hypothetical protein
VGRTRAPVPTPLALTIDRDTVIPASGIAGGYSFVSNTQEPSTGAHGNIIFQTGNWYASRSFDNGATWSSLDPFSIFGFGFCCDQVTLYEPVRDRQFWLLQYSDHLTLVSSGGSDLDNWCGFNIFAGAIGEPSTTELDYNDVAVSNNYIYFTTNYFPVAATPGSAIVRFNTDDLAACPSSISYDYLALGADTGGFMWKPVQGAQDTMYWGTDGGPGPIGASFRLYGWPEIGGISFTDYTIDPFVYFTRSSGQNCASADGVVTNWCQFSDSRTLGGYRANGVIGFSFNAKQDDVHPFPYTRRVYINEVDLSYLRSDDLWATNAALLLLSLAPNGSGDVGGSFAWGGGTDADHFYPGGGALIEDALTPTPPWETALFLTGGGNTCTSGGIPRWGDYLTARGYSSDPTRWVATSYAIQGGNCGSPGAYSEPHNLIFGR